MTDSKPVEKVSGMTRAYHTWRQDAQELYDAGWELTACGRMCAKLACAEWLKRHDDGSISSETAIALDIVDAIREATRKAMKRMEQLRAGAKA